MRIALDPRTRVRGTTLVGGELVRVMRLSPPGPRREARRADAIDAAQARLGGGWSLPGWRIRCPARAPPT